jgi:CheY-like chemotaxis protein
VCRKVLQIDDDLDVSAALRVRLRAAGYELVSAHDGRSGLTAAAEHRPDAILLDIRMPEMDGFEVCRRLKDTSELAGIPVLFLSGNAGDEDRRTAGQLGAAGFLSKPYEPHEVIEAIEEAISAATAARRAPNAGGR